MAHFQYQSSGRRKASQQNVSGYVGFCHTLRAEYFAYAWL